MKRAVIISFVAVVAIAVIWVFTKAEQREEPPIVQRETMPVDVAQDDMAPGATFPVPIDEASERVTKKPFGIFVEPANSPVQPEKFRGYHSGTDFEAFENEKDDEVVVYAICPGEIVEKKMAQGYGGVLVTRCTIDNQAVTVLYGHLALKSVEKRKGERLEQGEIIGSLGQGGSADTDEERKHLHLSIHKGEATDLRGYVQNREELSQWIDPCLYVCSE